MIKEEINQSDFKFKSLQQIQSDENVNLILSVIAKVKSNKTHSPYYLNPKYINYLLRQGTVDANNYDDFINTFKKTISKFANNPQFKQLALKEAKEMINQNSINKREIPDRVISWILSIAADFSFEDIVLYDWYKLYLDVNVEKTSENWISYNQANMTSNKASVTFEFNGKEYKKDIELGSSGYWND